VCLERAVLVVVNPSTVTVMLHESGKASPQQLSHVKASEDEPALHQTPQARADTAGNKDRKVA
jgi:hypothetical protein